jgi:sigma-E factor negative regulatory protein RseC
MKEQGIITKVIAGNIVEVALRKSAACTKCGCCHELQENLVGLESVNEIAARPGEIVEIEIPTQAVVTGSLMIYLLPVFLLIFGYLFGSASVRAMGWSDSVEIAGVVSAFLFLAASFFVVRWYDQNIERKQAMRAKIIRIIKG